MRESLDITTKVAAMGWTTMWQPPLEILVQKRRDWRPIEFLEEDHIPLDPDTRLEQRRSTEFQSAQPNNSGPATINSTIGFFFLPFRLCTYNRIYPPITYVPHWGRWASDGILKGGDTEPGGWKGETDKWAIMGRAQKGSGPNVHVSSVLCLLNESPVVACMLCLGDTTHFLGKTIFLLHAHIYIYNIRFFYAIFVIIDIYMCIFFALYISDPFYDVGVGLARIFGFVPT